MLDVQSDRAVAEVQGAMTIAKRFPRDQNQSFARIIQSCKRKTLAESACYVYPRGGAKVSGPSIRLAEVLAREWGNLEYGIVELEQRRGESTVLAYAHDLETNTRCSKVFAVKHERRARGGTTFLDDPRDIYEMVANQGARRMRACILAIVPGDIVEAAVEQCDKTLATENGEPLADRVRKMVSGFTEVGVTSEELEARLGHKIAATDAHEIVTLGKIYRSLTDGMSKKADWFSGRTESDHTTDVDAESADRSEALANRLDAADGPAKHADTGSAADDGGTTEQAGEVDPAMVHKLLMLREQKIGGKASKWGGLLKRFGVRKPVDLTAEQAETVRNRLLQMPDAPTNDPQGDLLPGRALQEKLSTISGLVDKAGLPATKVDQMLEEVGIDSFADMNEDQADTMIADLEQIIEEIS
jgi:hypothetical protein